MCDPKSGPSQQLDLVVPTEHIPQVQQTLLDQFQLVPANFVTPGDEYSTISYVYYLDELTMFKWWKLLRYVQQQKSEGIILRSELFITKRHKQAVSDEIPETDDSLVQAYAALIAIEQYPHSARSLFGEAAPMVRHAILLLIDEIGWIDQFDDQNQFGGCQQCLQRRSRLF